MSAPLSQRRSLGALAETDLLAEARAGVEWAFAEIMQRHNRLAYRVAWSLVRNRVEAEDVVQEAYLKAFLNLGRFAGESSFATWLTRIVVNEALMRRRQRQRQQEAAPPGTLLDLKALANRPSSEATPEAALGRNELRHRLEQAIAQLPDEFRAVFVLRSIEQLSVEETAAALGIPSDTVKSRLFRARRRLRETMERELSGAYEELLPFAGARCAALGQRVIERLKVFGLIKPP